MAPPITKLVVVPWFHREEWEMVHQELFSEQIKLRKHAMARIAVWKCRQANRLPVAVDCTSQLVCAEVTDIEANQSGVSKEEVHLGYAMALVRFVNLITENAQTKAYARPIHYIAQEYGVPQWLVDIRHGATHGNMPSIHLLRTAASWALNWLKEEYWEISWHPMKIKDLSENGCEGREAQRKRQMDVLVRYMQHQFEVLETKQEDTAATKKIVSGIKQSILANREEFVMVLSMEGYLIPTKEQLESLNCEVPDLDDNIELAIPKNFRQFWKRALNAVRDTGSSSLLLKQLISDMDDRNGFHNQFRYAWVMHLIDCAKQECTRASSIKLEASYHSLFRKLLHICFNKPNKYTKQFVTSLIPLQQPALSKEQVKSVLHLLDVYVGNHHSDDTSLQLNESEPQTVDTFLSQTDGSSNNASNQEISCEEWQNVSMGVCQNVNVTTTNLELPEYLDRLQESSSTADPEDTPVSEYDRIDHLYEDMDTSVKVFSHADATHTSTSWLGLDTRNRPASISIF